MAVTVRIFNSNTSIILIASGFIDEGVIETIKREAWDNDIIHTIELIPDPAMDAKGNQGGFTALGAKVDDYESEKFKYWIEVMLQNQNVLIRLKLAGKWPPGVHAVES